MAAEPARDAALAPLAPGPLLGLHRGALRVELAPQAGGRIARIAHDGIDWLAGHAPDRDATIAWGCFPMLPWAGRIRRGRFGFDGREVVLPANLGAHAIHGVGFALPWRVEGHADDSATLSLVLPRDARWPFGGIAHQRIELLGNALHLQLSVTAGEDAMPATIGWHPWLRRPLELDFAPSAAYPRDAEGIATRPPGPPPPPPWDDCFLHDGSIDVHRGGRRLRLSSDCIHWVIYSEPEDVLCVEPQSGPPDAFNIEPTRLAPGATLEAWFRWEWA